MSAKAYDLHNPTGGGDSLFRAICILRRFPSTIPTAEQLVNAFSCSRATAYRWRAAIAAAHGVNLPRGHQPGADQPIPVPLQRAVA